VFCMCYKVNVTEDMKMNNNDQTVRINELLMQDLKDMYLGKIIYASIASVSLMINIILLYLLMS
jgi:hypothetical protein